MESMAGDQQYIEAPSPLRVVYLDVRCEHFFALSSTADNSSEGFAIRSIPQSGRESLDSLRGTRYPEAIGAVSTSAVWIA
jgi:hypothetical protein